MKDSPPVGGLIAVWGDGHRIQALDPHDSSHSKNYTLVTFKIIHVEEHLASLLVEGTSYENSVQTSVIQGHKVIRINWQASWAHLVPVKKHRSCRHCR